MNEKLKQLSQLNEQAQIDGQKFNAGNKTAGTRLRKTAMEITRLCKEIRTGVSEIKNKEA